MPYFLILPLFVLWLFVAGIAVVVMRVVPAFREAYPYAWRMFLWSTAGLIVANVAVIAIGLLGLVALGEGDGPGSAAQEVLASIFLVMVLLGPLLATVVGWLGGGYLGFVLARRSVGRLPLDTPPDVLAGSGVS